MRVLKNCVTSMQCNFITKGKKKKKSRLQWYFSIKKHINNIFSVQILIWLQTKAVVLSGTEHALKVTQGLKNACRCTAIDKKIVCKFCEKCVCQLYVLNQNTQMKLEKGKKKFLTRQKQENN